MLDRTALVMLCCSAACAIVAAPGSAYANPVALCVPGTLSQPSARTVSFEIDVDTSFVQGDVKFYRDVAGPGYDFDPDSPTAVLVSTFQASEGTASNADTGSGTVGTLRFTMQEECVPKGSWTYFAYAGDMDLYCYEGAVVTDDDAACDEDPDAGAGGAGGGTAGSAGAAGAGGGTSGSGGETGTAGTAGTGGNTSSAGAAGRDPDAGSDEDDGGCAVSATPSRAAGAGGLMLMLGLFGWLLRRR